MEIRKFVSRMMAVNCYVVSEQDTAVVIDPVVEVEMILDYLRKQELKLLAIVNTHGHADHIAGNQRLAVETGAPVWIHEADAAYLADPALNLSQMVLGEGMTSPKAERLLTDGDQITVGGTVLTVIHTPGHTPGSICLLGSGALFSGDTLFKASVGRSDFPGGDGKILRQSLQKLKKLPPETIIYPGHGQETSLKEELAHNFFLR